MIDTQISFRIFNNIVFVVFALILILSGCSSKPKQGILLRDFSSPPAVILDIFAQEGKSDYILMNDQGYAFRLIYLCENKVLNLTEEPEKNPILVSIHPILDNPIEKFLSPDDRIRIWACMERKVLDEQSRVENLKRRAIEERNRLLKELHALLSEKNQLQAEIENRKRQLAEQQRQQEEEARRIERLAEDRQRKAEEEAKRKAEEEKKIKFYRAGEKEEFPISPASTAPDISKKTSDLGVFLAMKETNVYESPSESSKIKARIKKYDLFNIHASQKDSRGSQWFQILLQERLLSTRMKKFGWSPEEKSFWVKNKLLVWVYPGDLAKIHSAKPIKLDPESVHFTGKKGSAPNKPNLFEVIYEVSAEVLEKDLGWVEEKKGIYRSNKTIDEMRTLLNELSLTLWPIRIQNDILAGNIRVGFSPEQVILAWGKPDHVNRTRTLVGVHEQWVYGQNPFPKSYVYFENGVVKSWEFLKPPAK